MRGRRARPKVPVVDGLAVDEAKSALVAAGFVVDRVNQVPDPRPPARW